MTIEIIIATATIVVIVLILTVAWAALSLAPWVPTRRHDLQRIIRVGGITSADTVYELGCGNGRVSLALAQRTGCSAVGIELAWPLYALCALRKIAGRHRQVRFLWGSFFYQKLTPATVVYFFGMPRTVSGRLKRQLERELTPGTRIVSYSFAIDGWEPAHVDKPSQIDIPIYVYIR